VLDLPATRGTWDDPVAQVAEALGNLERRGGGLSLGLPRLETVTGGAIDGELWTLGGRTGHGKTTVSLNVVAHLTAAGIPVLVFSQEVAASDWRLRLACLRCALPYQSVRQGWWNSLAAGAREEIEAELRCQRGDRALWVFGESSVTPARAIAVGKRYVRDHDVRLIVVDHLHRMRLKGRDRRTEIGEAARELKNLALESGAVVLLLAQLARPEDDLAALLPPSLLQLKEAGEIENESDKVLLVHRTLRDMSRQALAEVRSGVRDVATIVDPNVMCIRVAKQRDGGPVDVTVRMTVDPASFRIFDRAGSAS
jgi:replicative DNA helicase